MVFPKWTLSIAAVFLLASAPNAAGTPDGTKPEQLEFAERAAPNSPATQSPRPERRPNHVEGEVILRFKSQVAEHVRSQTLAMLGERQTDKADRRGYQRVKLDQGWSVEQAIAAYSADPNVEHVQPNYLYYAQTPNDPLFDELWGLNNLEPPGNDIDALSAWEHISDCNDAVVAVLDTGVNYTHEDLQQNMWEGLGYDMVDNDDDPLPTGGNENHGTHVAGTIGAVGNNETGITGVCQEAGIMAVRVLGADGAGNTADIVKGIDFAVDNGARIINMSMGALIGFDEADTAMEEAIQRALEEDVLVIAAAGNDERDLDEDDYRIFPCSFPHDNLLCVTALNQSYELASFSNYGSQIVDLGAPGTNILSTWGGRTIEEPLDNDSWVFTGDWDIDTECLRVNALVNPSDWCQHGQYNLGADERAYKTFTLPESSLAASWIFGASVNLDDNHFFRVAARDATDADPFEQGGTRLAEITGIMGDTMFEPFIFELAQADCIENGDCTLGFQLDTDDNGQPGDEIDGIKIDGISVILPRLATIEDESSVYIATSGTSMATPHVAGVAALVRAFSPEFTFKDTRNALIKGGREVDALADFTVSGRAVDAMGALSWIDPPTGLEVSQ